MENKSLKQGWKGFLSFTFEVSGSRTVVKDKKHYGPLVLQRPYYQEIERPMVLIIHPPGGIAGGDELNIEVKCQSASQSMVSTPAATKFYRSAQKLAKQKQRITLEAGSELEWLPQETLFFNDSYAENELCFELTTADAKLIAWDVVGLGRPARDELYQKGALKQVLKVFIAGKLILKDQLIMSPSNQFLQQLSGVSESTLFATMIVYADKVNVQKLLDKLQQQEWAKRSGLGFTLVQGVVVVRMLASNAEEIKQTFFEIWKLARPIVLNKEVVKPRIWNT